MRKAVALQVLLLVVMQVFAQKPVQSERRWIDSIRTLISDSARLQSALGLHFDSGRFKKVIQDDTVQLQKLATMPALSSIKNLHKPLLKFDGGSISYDWNYRDHIDTPFQEQGIAQHLVTARGNFTIAGSYPITVSYVDRETNSNFFRDYHDLRVEFNSLAYDRLRAVRLNAYLDRLANSFRDPSLKPALGVADGVLDRTRGWLNQRDVITRLLQSRATLLNAGDTRDSAVAAARHFIDQYNRVTQYEEKLKAFRDSLQQAYVATEKKVTAVRKIMSGRLSPAERETSVRNLMHRYGMEDDELDQKLGRLSGIRTLAAGKLVPNYSDLTLKNVSLNGLNFEYNRGIYFALAAGAVDYRVRDFFYTRRATKPQLVYMVRTGYGNRQGSHVFITAFKGRKQLLNSSENPQVLDIYGLAFEAQVQIAKNIRMLGEVAQSAAPGIINASGPQPKSGFHLNDARRRAYSLSASVWLPKTSSRLDGYYRSRGIDFQSFSSYYINASTTAWQVRNDQYFWKRALHLTASVSKNNYENSYLPVRYVGNTVSKNIILSFHRNHLPSLTVGFMPSSQLSEVNGQVYANYYESLSAASSYAYRIGLARAATVVSYNRFYNDSKDSGFIYYNARNFYLTQNFQFLLYSASVNISRSISRDYELIVLDAGVNTNVFKAGAVGFGVKINELNGHELKTGLYGNARLLLKDIGELNAWIEKAYLPAWKNGLQKNELYHISFTRFFNPQR